MDQCIPSLVVNDSEDRYIVEQVPLSIVDANFDGIARLVHAGVQSHTPVIRMTSESTHSKTELHPLEAEIQRDRELKHRQQQEYRQNTSVIHPVPDTRQITLQPKSFQICTTTNSTVHHIIKSDPITHVLQKPVMLNGNEFIVVDGTTPILHSTWEMQRPVSELVADLNEPVEPSQIPLTVANYNHSKEDENKKVLEVKKESDSEEEEEELQPVQDHEPDPESEPNGAVEGEEGKPHKCYVCTKSFRQKKNMYAHIRKVHSTQPKVGGGILCPLCKMYALRQEHLRNHLQALHDITVEKEERQFGLIQEFMAWKEHVERETLSLYVSKTETKLLANNQQKTYYKCHRSGNYMSDRKERKKRLKVQGSNKIGATCPAAMEVTENIHGVTVVFWKTHVGHSNDLVHLSLGKEERARISEFMSAGVPWNEVLERIRKETEKKPDMSPRLQLITKQDLRNMKKTLEIHKHIYPELFPEKKRVNLGKKPVKERILRRASQALVIEKAEVLLNILETTDVIPEFRPKVCLMIDNLISTVKRRAEKDVYNRQNNYKRRQLMERDKEANGNKTKKGSVSEDISSEDSFQESSQVQETVIKSSKKQKRRPKKQPSDQSPPRKLKQRKQ